MVYSPDMSGGSSESYSGLEPTDLGDITQHPAHNLPAPGQQPVGPRGTQMAGEVLNFPSSAATVMPETTRVKNMISEQNMRVTGSKPGSNVVKIPNDRYK